MRVIRILPALCLATLGVGISYSPKAAAADSSTETPSTAPETTPTDELRSAANLTVADRGPGRPWLLKIENRGESDLELVGDLRLLWFEVKVPGQKKPVECRLPKTMLSTKAVKGAARKLKAGEEFVRHFDPRFYCFAEGDQRVLVPGAILTPHFGWNDDTKVSWARGKRIVTVLPATPPLVLSTIVEEPAEESPKAEEDSSTTEEPSGNEELQAKPAEPESPPPPVGIRHLDGTPFALGSNYAVWSAARLPDKSAEKDLRLRVVKGSDAETERNVTLTIGMTNQTTEPLRLFFRRELLDFDVVGPDGNKVCTHDDIPREPEKQAFLSLAPGREMLITTRLLELCPRGTFAEPGLYLVNAALNASYSGEAYGLDAFVGEVAASSSRPVRVRKSEEPYLVTTPMPTGAAAVPAQAGAIQVPPPPAPVQVVPTPQPAAN